MNKNKKGFTISELLLCFAIVGVVSAMGMTLSKYNVEKAFNTYWPAGYSNLLSAIVEFEQRPGNSQTLLEKCDEIFRDADRNDPGYVSPQEVTAQNGIRYYNYHEDASGQVWYIDMEVPQSKTRARSAGKAWTRFLYNPEALILFPVPQGYIPQGDPDISTYVDLSDSNILKFTVKDGIKGNRKMDGEPLGTERLEVQTFREAYCRSRYLRDKFGNGSVPADLIQGGPGWNAFVDPETSCGGYINPDLEGMIELVF